jgi:hypothetical protein
LGAGGHHFSQRYYEYRICSPQNTQPFVTPGSDNRSTD